MSQNLQLLSLQPENNNSTDSDKLQVSGDVKKFLEYWGDDSKKALPIEDVRQEVDVIHASSTK